MTRALPLLLLLACEPAPAPSTPTWLKPGAPLAGAAEGSLDLPIGAPMGGYSSRCRFLGGDTTAPTQDSNYIEGFVPSVGLQTRPMGKVIWLSNSDQDLVLIKLDLIYSYDGLVERLEQTLGAATGRDLNGRLVVSTSHSHSSYGNFSDQVSYYLGGDRYNEEIFERLVERITALGAEAWAAQQPASLGLGLAKDWDPNNQVYSDRRGDNDNLQFFDDIPTGSYKDPNLWLLRVDSAAGDPIALLFSFGMHGTVLDGDSPMLSVESTGHVELALQEEFDTPVVVAHLQGGAGDASPRGQDDGYARLESIGALATPAIYGLWQATTTSADPIALEAVTRAIPEDRDQIEVTRDGTVDLTYAPYDPELVPDEIVFNEDGSVASPIDEFNVPYGGAFCGSGIDGLSDLGTGSQTYPYNTCLDVTWMASALVNWFHLTEFNGTEDFPLPIPEATAANATAVRLGPLPILEATGDASTDDVLLAFFPGEPTALYTEQFRRRAAAEAGWDHAYPVGYSQDHEGYLLVPEDWLMGGYEPNINIWGPLQGEHILEGVLAIARDPLQTDVLEPQDPLGWWPQTTYPDRALPTLAPDDTPLAGTALSSPPDDFYIPLDLPLAVRPDATVPRVQGVAQLMWEGGDPGVDLPRVALEELIDGSWQVVRTRSGREVTDAMPDILLVHQASPLLPAEDPQTHTWWAGWQAVGHDLDRAGLPLGTYRLHVTGKRALGGTETWPWPTEDYELATAPFQLVPGQISIGWDGATLSAWLAAPQGAWRLLDLDGTSTGTNPIAGATVTWELADGSTIEEDGAGTTSGGVTVLSATPPSGTVAVTVTDIYGNTGRLAL